MTEQEIQKRAEEIGREKGYQHLFYNYPQLGFRDDNWVDEKGNFLSAKQLLVKDLGERTGFIKVDTEPPA